MTEKNKAPEFHIPEDIQEKAQEVVKEALQELSQNAAALKKSIEAFRKHHSEVRERIDRGARKTDGRIV